MTLTKLLKQAEKFTTDNSPAILTAVGVVGVLTTAYFTGDATIKAVRLLDDEKAQRELDARTGARPHGVITFDKLEVVKLVWKLYIPPVGTGILTVAAIISSNHISSKRTTAIAAAYSLSERGWQEYKEKVVERLGEKKEQSIRDEVAQDQVTKAGMNAIWIAEDMSRCLEAYTSRPFSSTMEAIRRAENDVNKEILDFGYASLSFFYDALDIPHTSFSDDVGWNSDNMLEVKKSAVVAEDGKPVLVITYNPDPSADFSRFG